MSIYEERRKLKNRFALGPKGEIAAIREDGSLFLLYTQNKPDNQIIESNYWAHLVSVKINKHYLAGLRDDGDILLMDENGQDISDLVSTWHDIKEIAVTHDQLFALSKSGDVFATFGRIDNNVFKSSRTVAHIFAGRHCIVSLDKKGRAMGFGDGQLPTLVSMAENIKDVFCSNSLDETFVILNDGTLLGNSNNKEMIYVPSEDNSSVIQCHITGSGNLVYLTEKYHIYKDGRKLFLDQEDYSHFDAFTISIEYPYAVMAVFAYGTNSFAISINGLTLSKADEQKIRYFSIHSAMTTDKGNETVTIQDVTEEKLNVLHAIDSLSSVKQKNNILAAQEMDVNISQLECSSAKGWEKMHGLCGTLALFINKPYYDKLLDERNQLLTKLHHLYEKHYDLSNWQGPYRISNPNMKYSCPGWCDSDPLEFVVWRRHLVGSEKPLRPLGSKITEREWAKHAWKKETLCIDCIVSHNLYCVGCVEVVNYTENRNRVEYDGYCVCESCIAEKQKQYSLAGKYVGKCSSCGKSHVPLKLIGKQLICDNCQEI